MAQAFDAQSFKGGPGKESHCDELKRLQDRVRELETRSGTTDRHDEAPDSEWERLQTFAEATGGWFWETDSQLRFTYFSPSVYKKTGVRPEWHYGKTREDLGVPESVTPEEWQSHLNLIKAHKPFKDFVYQRKGPDGLKWLSTTGLPVFDKDGAFQGYRGAANDVTAEIAAKRRAEQLIAAIENLDEIFALWGPDDRLVTCNQGFRDLNARVIESTEPGSFFADHIRAALSAGLYPGAAGREEDWYRDRLERHRNPGAPLEMPRQDGRWIMLREHRLPDGSTATISTDISERKRAERELANKNRILEAALKTIPDGIQILDADLNLVGWNDQLFAVMDLDRDSILCADNPGKAFRYALASRGEYGEGDLDAIVASREAIARSPKPVQYERQLVTGKWMECRGNPVEGGGYLAVYRDIDAAKRAALELEDLARIDPLTSLHNRRSFFEIATAEFKRAERYGHQLSVMMLDVDHFKSVNDRYGHGIGDEVLCQVANACRETLRDPDTIGRLGGEEFAILLPDTGSDRVELAGERVRRAVEILKMPTPAGPLTVTVSIGVASCAPHHACIEEVITEADAALYEAKKNGRNRVEKSAGIRPPSKAAPSA